MNNLIIIILLGMFAYYLYTKYKHLYLKLRDYFSYMIRKNHVQHVQKDSFITKETLSNGEVGMFVSLIAKIVTSDTKQLAIYDTKLISQKFNELISKEFHSIPPNSDEFERIEDLLKDIFNNERHKTHNIDSLSESLNYLLRKDESKREFYMGFLIQLAFVNNKISKDKENLIQIIAKIFNYNPELYHALFNQFESGLFEDMLKNIIPTVSLIDIYTLLGVDTNNGVNDIQDEVALILKNNLANIYMLLDINENDNIKGAYRKLIPEYYPSHIDLEKIDGKYMEKAYIRKQTADTEKINELYSLLKDKQKN